jgi:hypothetical protein
MSLVRPPAEDGKQERVIMLLRAGLVAIAFALCPLLEATQTTNPGNWEVVMANVGASRSLAVTASNVIIQINEERDPAMITVPGLNCPGKPLILRVDDNEAVLLGEKGRRNVRGAIKQMLSGRKAILAYYERPCETSKRLEIDLTGLAAALERAAALTNEEIEGLEALLVAEEEAQAESALEAEAKRNPTGALLNAARDGNYVQVLALLQAGADVNARSRINGYTPLIWASSRGHTETVHALLEEGAEINARLGDGQTALMRASENGHVEIVKALLEAGADVNASTDRGITALRLAELREHDPIIALLKQAGAGK